MQVFMETLSEWDIHPQDADNCLNCLRYINDKILEPVEFGTAVRKAISELTLEEIAVRMALEHVQSQGYSTVLDNILRRCEVQPDDIAGVLLILERTQFRLILEKAGIHEEDSIRVFF